MTLRRSLEFQLRDAEYWRRLSHLPSDDAAWLQAMTAGDAGVTVRLTQDHSLATARALELIGGDAIDAARLLVFALSTLEFVLESELRRPVRRSLQQALQQIGDEDLTRELGDLARWPALRLAFYGLSKAGIERAATEAAMSPSGARRALLEMLHDRGRPGRTIFLWEEVDMHLLERGFTPGEAADLVLASGTDWDPDPCRDYRVQFEHEGAQVHPPRTRLLQDLNKKRRAFAKRSVG